MSEQRYILPERDSELEALLDVKIAPAPLRSPHVGDVIAAKIRAISDEIITLATEDGLDIYVPTADARPVGGDELPKVGSTHQVLLEVEEEPDVWTGSIHRAYSLQVFEDILIAANEDEEIEATITVALRGGFSATYKDLRCFIPGRESGIQRNEALEHVGRTYKFDIKDFDRKTCQLILTRRERADEQQRNIRKQAFDQLAVGDIVEGTVKNVLNFGAFVDVGGIDGLLHVSEISLHHVEHPAELISRGEVVQVKITKLDAEKLKVGLSRKDLLYEEHRVEIDKLEVGEIYDGTVSSLVDFGAFIEVAPEIEGLCHVSEIKWSEHVEHPSEVLELGQKVRVRLLSKDADAQRLSLSIRQTEENPWNAVIEQHPPGSVVEGTITRIEDYGLFVKIAEGIEGLCHVSDLSWDTRPETPLEFHDYQIGDSIETKILDIDINRQRIGLGVKHLTTDPWDEAGDKVKEGAVFTARVTRFGNDAAYLAVAAGLEGRIHISEVSTERVDSIRAELHIDQEIEVMVVRADRQRRRLDLSIKAIEEKRLSEQPSSFNEEVVMNPLSEALAAHGITRTTTVEAEKGPDQPADATDSFGEFATDADLIQGFEAQVAGLKGSEDENTDADVADVTGSEEETNDQKVEAQASDRTGSDDENVHADVSGETSGESDPKV